MTIKELEIENSKLNNRLSKAVIFELAPNISIGISEEDSLWRIRRDIGAFYSVFLNKDGEWDDQPAQEDIDFAYRTGYTSSSEALDAFDDYIIKNPLFQLDDNLVFETPQIQKNIAKNN